MKIPAVTWQDNLSLHLSAFPGWASFIKWRAGQMTYPWQEAYHIDLVKHLAVRLFLFYERELVEATCQQELRCGGDAVTLHDAIRRYPYAFWWRQTSTAAAARYTTMVTGLIGVMTGNQSDLRMGLPVQSLFTSVHPYHEPLPLTAIIEAPRTLIATIIARQPLLQQLFNNHWLRLILLGPDERTFHRYEAGKGWTNVEGQAGEADRRSPAGKDVGFLRAATYGVVMSDWKVTNIPLYFAAPVSSFAQVAEFLRAVEMACILRGQSSDGTVNFEAVAQCLQALGRLDRKYRSIHVTGTNGKTTVSRMIAALLRAGGMRVGLYTSPYLTHFRERISEEPHAVVTARAAELNAPLLVIDREYEVSAAVQTGFTTVCSIRVGPRRWAEVTLNSSAAFMATNAAHALASYDVLRRRGLVPDLAKSDVHTIFEQTDLAGC